MMRNPWWLGILAGLTAVGVVIGVLHRRDVSLREARVVAQQEAERKAADRLEERVRRPAPEIQVQALPAVHAVAEAPKAVAPAPAPEKPGKKNAFARMMERTARMMDTPEMQEQARHGMKPQMLTLYYDLLDECNLGAEARSAVEDLLIDRVLAEGKLNTLCLDERLTEEDILKRQDEGLARSQADLGRYLTPAQISRLETEIPQRVRARQVDASLAPLALPDGIRDQVRACLLDELRTQKDPCPIHDTPHFERKTAEDIRNIRAFFMGDMKAESAKSLASTRAQHQRLQSRIQPFLTPEQLAAYRKQQDEQAAAMEMGFNAMESMAGVMGGE